MTTEEKAKRYDEALERLKGLIEGTRECRCAIVEEDIIDIFPELKESEDEKVREELITHCRNTRCVTEEGAERIARWIAWLEKQGELKPNPYTGTSFEYNGPFDKYEGLTNFERTLADICNGWIGEEIGWKQYIKDNADVLLKIAIEKFNSIQDAPFEQQSKWTKEDEKYIDNCCLLIGAADDCYEKPFQDDCIHYLQSLKERIAWKPKWSDEDEKRLQSCISTLQGKGLMGGVDTINTKWLKSIKQRIEEQQ